MRIDVVVPVLPESVADASVAHWHHRPGDLIVKDTPLLDLETDKVVLEVPAPTDGRLIEVRHAEGDIVVSGALLAVIESEDSSNDGTQSASESANAPHTPSDQPVSPAVRRLMNEHQLSLDDIPVTGRINKQDVLRVIEARKERSPEISNQEDEDHPQNKAPLDKRVPMSRIRSRIAERMIEAQQTTATLTTFNEVNLERVFALRNEHRQRFEQRHGVKLGLMSFFVKASIEALKRFPIVNASIEGNDIVYHDGHHIGIAVTTERGLVVPVLRNAERLSFAEIERSIVDYSLRGRDGLLRFEELAGGTFTITNGGIFGSMLSTPILNPPQSAILGMHAIKDRPVVEDGKIVIRPIIYLALSYDHRIIDGREAVSFLFVIKELLEDPSRLLLEV